MMFILSKTKKKGLCMYVCGSYQSNWMIFVQQYVAMAIENSTMVHRRCMDISHKISIIILFLKKLAKYIRTSFFWYSSVEAYLEACVMDFIHHSLHNGFHFNIQISHAICQELKTIFGISVCLIILEFDLNGSFVRFSF